MNKFLLMFLLLVANTAFAEDLFASGELYKGQPIICSTHNDAAELAEIYANKSLNQFSDALNLKTKGALCFFEITIGFIPIREASVHKGKETVYVIEVLSGGLFYVVTLRRVFKFSKKSIAI